MAKHTLRIVRFERSNIFEVYFAIFKHYEGKYFEGFLRDKMKMDTSVAL